MTEGADWAHPLSAEDLMERQRCLAEANRNNVFCHCRRCEAEWVASGKEDCHRCGSSDVEAIACWQFPDG